MVSGYLIEYINKRKIKKQTKKTHVLYAMPVLEFLCIYAAALETIGRW